MKDLKYVRKKFKEQRGKDWISENLRIDPEYVPWLERQVVHLLNQGKGQEIPFESKKKKQ